MEIKLLFYLCFLTVDLSQSEQTAGTNSTTSCVNQRSILKKNEVVLKQIYADEACSFSVTASGGQGIRIDILKPFARSVYDYFIVQEIGLDCLDNTYAMTGLESKKCAMYLPCNAIEVNITSLVEFQIQLTGVYSSSWTPSDDNPDYVLSSDQSVPGHDLLDTCTDFVTYDAVHRIPYTVISYDELTEYIRTLDTFFRPNGFIPTDLPDFDLDTPAYMSLVEFPICPDGCTCTLGFQWLSALCPDVPVHHKTFFYFSFTSSDRSIVLSNKVKAYFGSPKNTFAYYYIQPLHNILLESSSYYFDTTNIYPESTVLLIRRRQLVHIEPHSFANLANVSFLLLSLNEITNIELGTFTGLEHLHTLDLSDNRLSNIKAGVFSNLSTLRQLFLYHNMLLFVAHSHFCGLDNLQVLDIGSNVINEIEPNTFFEIPSLQILFLNNNNISQLSITNSNLLVLDVSYNYFTNLNIDESINAVHLPFKPNQLMRNSRFNRTMKLAALDLSGNSMSVIPGSVSILSQLKKLGMSFNKLESLPSDILRNLSKLDTLDLSSNRLGPLPPDVFRNLSHLGYLDLSSNRLGPLPPDIFRNLSQLGYLDLSSNRLGPLPPDVFRDLSQLEDLGLYNISIESLQPDVFRNLSQLKRLNLGNNRLELLSPDVFNDLSELSHLFLNSNKLKSLPPEVFRDLSQLGVLYLTNNSFESLPPDVFRDLPQLFSLNLDNNSLESLPPNVFRNLFHLRSLQMPSNRLGLHVLPPDVFRNLSELITLIMSSNRLELLPPDIFTDLSQLLWLILSNNSFKSLPLDVFRDLTKLQLLDLSDNMLKPLPPQTFRDLPQLEYLALSSNRLGPLSPDVFRNLFQLEDLFLSSNKLEVLPPNVFRDLSQLTRLDLGNNSFESLPLDVFINLFHLTVLYLYNNRLQSLSADVFINCSSLQYLDLSDNKLESLPSDVFINLSQLQYLNIPHNKIASLSPDIFRNLSELKYLILTHNKVASLPPHAFRNLSQLRYISLDNNKISSLSADAFHGLKNLKLLYLQNNTITTIQGKIFNLTKLLYVNLWGNDLTIVTSNSFLGLNGSISVDNPAICQCFLTSSQQEKCIPKNKKSSYITCEQLLPTITVKCFTWIFSFLAIVANMLVIIWGFQQMRSKQVHQKQLIFITNLAIADFLMGLYLLIISSADQYYNKYFPSYAETWHKSILCKFAGLLSVLSSEASLLFLVLIATDRIWAFRKMFVTYKLFGRKTQRLLTLSVWFMSFIISIVTLFLKGDKLYQFSDVCIGLPLARRLLVEADNKTVFIPRFPDLFISRFAGDVVQPVKFDYEHTLQTYKVTGKQVGNYFSIGLFLGFNCLLCLTVAICYIFLFLRILRSRHTLFKTDIKMAIKMGAIALTDLMCWLPIVVIGILAQTGVKELPPVVFPWITAFALPINSVINPFLYATIDKVSHRFVRRLERPACYREMETML